MVKNELTVYFYETEDECKYKESWENNKIELHESQYYGDKTSEGS